jgi:single-stranded DNA-specific DHH superfamily exonuclease
MLVLKDVSKVRELLDSSQNPLFFFDNDPDGLASFLLLRRCINNGKGVVIKSFPELNSTYIRKLHEFKPDCVFVLDKPLIDPLFIEATRQLGIKLVWIDHHPPQQINEEIYYFNPLLNEQKTNEPVAYWCYKIAARKEDLWIALFGCLGDWFLPEFHTEFAREYPDLFLGNVQNASEALYKTQIGKIAKILSFALKDKTSNVIKMLKFLVQIKSPYELLEENSKTSSIYFRYNQINRKYTKLIEKARLLSARKILFFQYGGDLSISGELANELFYLFPDRIICVAFLKGNEATVSFRANINIRDKVAEAMKGIDGRSGGHRNACAAKLSVIDLPRLKENLEKLL